MQRILPHALIALALVAAGAVHADEDVAALIKRQSQAFSDASASNDLKTLARYLDDRVVFINENGDIATKADIVAPGPAGPTGISNKLVQTDFHVEIHGNVAVTRFTDNATVRVGEQTLKPRFRSTEVWLDENGDWRMISSQTVALSDDPPTVALAPADLDQYVGTYRAAPAFTVVITRQGDHLFGATNSGKPLPLLAEVRDVLFTPGQPRVRKVFERDGSGKVIGFVSRREGHGLTFTKGS